MKLRTTDPWMPAVEYARSLQGLRVNLLDADGHCWVPDVPIRKPGH